MPRPIAWAVLAAAAAWGVYRAASRPAITVTAAPGNGNGFALRVTLGHGDAAGRDWSGSMEVAGGTITGCEGWKLYDGDAVTAPCSWSIRGKREMRYRDAAARRRSLQFWEEPPGDPAPSGLFVYGDAPETARLTFRSAQGEFATALGGIGWEAPRAFLDGAVEVQRLPAPRRLSPEMRENDFPSIAVGPDGSAWAVWQSYTGGSDEIHLARHTGGQWLTYSPLPGVSGDVWQPRVAVDRKGVAWVVWSQQDKGDWDLYALAHHGGRIEGPVRLTNSPGPDIHARLAVDSADRLHVVWQGARGNRSRIYLKYRDGGKWSEEFTVSPPAEDSNAWAPAVAADAAGAVHVAWDSYRSGSYDVFLRTFRAPGELGKEIAVARTSRYEAHAAVACDRRNRVWVAWEEGLPNWGKDLAAALPDGGPGTALGDPMEVKVRVFDNGEAMEPAAQPQTAFAENERSVSRYPELAVDSEDRVWLLFRHLTLKGRTEKYTNTRGRGHWGAWLSCYTGDRWSPPALLASSGGRISSFSGMAPAPGGGVWAAWQGDGREWADLLRPRQNHVFAGYAAGPRAAEAKLAAAAADTGAAAPAIHRDEPADVSRLRKFRLTAGGKTYRLLRGELHRHAELSRDQGGGRDGSILDFYRYMLDAADMDFGGITEHSNGFNDYWSWLLQKTTDLFHRPGYTGLYGYERTATYPFGHRNIFHARRGVPLVDFFTRPAMKEARPDVHIEGEKLVENDTTLLNQELRRTGGIAIAHTTATTHGTDWKQYDPAVEPVVEIYQGLRQNYERLNAPRGVVEGKGGSAFREPGLVSNAWAMGHRLGVISSSDHVATHTSYAMVYTESPGREGVLGAIRRRHTYGATDNILLVCRMGGHIMGDEFRWKGEPQLDVRVEGTGPIARVVIVRDNQVVYTAEPGKKEAALTWRDRAPTGARSFYYVRVEQADGQLAWSSPLWVSPAR